MSFVYFSNVRCSFPNLAEPFRSQKFPGSPPMFSMDVIDIDPNNPQVKEFMAQYSQLALNAWKEHAGPVMQSIQGDKRARCFGMGAEKVNEQTFKPLDGYGQGVWINAKNKNRPQMIRTDGKQATSDMEALELARKIYGGCRVNVALKPWIRTGNRGVSCDLVAVQFAGDDKAFGEGAVDASGMFGALAGVAAPAPSFLQPAAAQMPLPPFMSAQ